MPLSVPASEPSEAGHGFGTAPVFLASISTILGAILFLRFGYAVGHVGLWGAMMIIVIGHMVTIPTVLAVSEIATNRRIAGGGAYFIISRSFGTTIGGSIGIALYICRRRSRSPSTSWRSPKPSSQCWSGSGGGSELCPASSG